MAEGANGARLNGGGGSVTKKVQGKGGQKTKGSDIQADADRKDDGSSDVELGNFASFMEAFPDIIPTYLENALMIPVLIAATRYSYWPWLPVAALSIFNSLGGDSRANQALTFRETAPGYSDGLFFALCIGPVVAALHEDKAQWLCGGSLEVLVAFASCQILVDLSFTMPLWSHAPQIFGFAMVACMFTDASLQDAVALLSIVKIVLTTCLCRKLWGRCFTLSEAVFWAQGVAVLVTGFFQGAVTNFEGWRTEGMFCAFIAAFVVAHMSFASMFSHFLDGVDGGAPRWASITAAVILLEPFVAWSMMGLGWPGAGQSKETPIDWFTAYLTTPDHAQYTCQDWPTILLLGVGWVHVMVVWSLPEAQSTQTEKHERQKILFRKAFHAVAVLLFVPPLLTRNGNLLCFCLFIVTLVFIVIETCRVCKAPIVAFVVDGAIGRFLNKREDISHGDLVMTHIYLLIGCAVPIWIEQSMITTVPKLNGWRTVLSSAGILSVGVGDACAACWGAYFGKWKWPHSNRTFEGSFAYVCSFIVSANFLLVLASRESDGWPPGAALRILVAIPISAILSALLEVYTQSIDNLVLPLYTAAVMKLIGG